MNQMHNKPQRGTAVTHTASYSVELQRPHLRLISPARFDVRPGVSHYSAWSKAKRAAGYTS